MPCKGPQMNRRWAISRCSGGSWTRERKRRLRASARIPALLLASFVVFPFLARAQQAAARLLVALASIGIVVVIYSLLKYKGAAVGPLSWGLLIAGAVASPLLITGVGTILVFERAERVEFCASCHLTMKSFVDYMKDSKSNSLAALHFRNR